MRILVVILVAILAIGLLPREAPAQTYPIGFGPDPCQGHEVCIALVPNDPRYPEQYGPQRISAPAAWDLTTGGASTIIAIVDTGIDCTHPDIAVKCLPGRNVTTGTDLTGTENSDDHGHGSHVSSTAAGATNNATGVAGICWDCKVQPVKVLGSSGAGTWAWVADGIRWAADHGAHIINMSLGGSSPDQGVLNAVDYAWGRGVLVVSACGNTGAQPCLYPAAYANSMAVSCTDSADGLCSFTSRGIEVDISAPGYNVLAAVPTGACSLCDPSGYRILSGTSMSTPHVAGVAGLVKSLKPATTNEQLYGLLEQSADDKGPVGYDTDFGFGRVNAHRALIQTPPSGRLPKTPGGPTPTITPLPPTSTPTAVPSPTRTLVPSPTWTVGPSPSATPCRTNPNGRCIGRDHEKVQGPVLDKDRVAGR